MDHLISAWNAHHKSLRAFIGTKIKCAEDANDILQDVFLKAHQHLDQVADRDKTVKWLYAIARNAMADHFRRSKWMVDGKLDTADTTEETVHGQLGSHKCVRGFIAKLPPSYREALIRSDLRGESQRSLSASLNLSYSALKSRVQRARQMLKSRLESCCRIIHDKYGNVVEHVPLHGKCACE